MSTPAPPLTAATCHCGAVRIAVRRLPRTVVSCNCSLCRRYGALWAYYRAGSVRISAPRGALERYAFKRRIRAYCRCSRCGCVTHYVHLRARRQDTVAVNLRNFAPAALEGVRIRHLDGARTWRMLD